MRRWLTICILTVVLVSCAGPGPGAGTAQSNPGAPAARQSEPKRVVAAIRGAPISIAQLRTQPNTGSVPGLDAVEELVGAGLVHLSNESTVLPQLAESVPTVDNGLWRVFPDGRMETTVRIRPNARWQDGTPLTSDDVLFTTMVEQDRETGMVRSPTYDLISSITAPDPLTVVVAWKQPYIEADAMFSHDIAPPMPKHLLEAPYTDDKAAIFNHPYWNERYVGAGPYRIKEWVPDSRIVVSAYEDYVLGRPKIDEIEVRFIPDPNTLMANLLAGVEMTLSRGISIDQAVRLTEQWTTGQMLTGPYGWIAISPQFITPNPPVVLDYRFRRAILEAVNREQLLETLMYGRGWVANSFVSPAAPEETAIEPQIMKYAYDPRHASQLLSELGYTKGNDGMLVDAGGQPLSVSAYFTVQNDLHPKATAAVLDFWKQVGVAGEQNPVSIQRATDREYRAQFPAFDINEITMDLSSRSVRRFHSESTPLPENRYASTGNASRYRSPELDSYIDTFLTTIPRDERLAALGKMVHHQTENLTVMGLLNTVRPTMVTKRLKNVTAVSSRATEAWNVHEWDVQ
jgi:peptide/nickel transport system substrate-binding protein